MRSRPDHRPRAQGRHLIRPALLAFGITLFSGIPSAFGAPDDPILYTGAFRALQVDLGTAPPWASDQLTLGLSARAATVLSLLDGEGRYTLRLDEGRRVHRVGVSAHLHPLALTALLNHQWGRWLSAASVHLGGGIALTEGGEEMAFGAWWSYGGAVDMPLTDPDQGHAFWAGLLYEKSGFSAAIEQKSVSAVSLRLGYRTNGI